MKSQTTIRNFPAKKKDASKLGVYISEEKLRMFRKLIWGI